VSPGGGPAAAVGPGGPLRGGGVLRPSASLRPPRAPVGWPAWRLRDAIVAGELRAVDVVHAHLERLDEVEPRLHAAVALRPDAALREAEELQDRLDAGLSVGPLCGVPFTVKDIIATAGMPTRCGSAAFADNVPAVDARAVARLRAAGGVLIAKTNCPEFAFGVTTDNAAFGETRSPWGDHSPGGSSGGEAALVCAGASALGLGTDYGGSLRWPAQCCGLVALRPGLVTVDGTGVLPEGGGRMDGHAGRAPWGDSVQRHFQVIGPIARTVRDLEIALAVISGPGPLAETPGRTTSASAGGLESSADPVDRLSIGWIVAENSQRVGSDVEEVVRSVVAELGHRGVVVEETAGVLDGLHEAFNDLRDTDRLADLRGAVGDRRALVGDDARRLLDCSPLSAMDPALPWAELGRLRERVLGQLERTPVLLLPVAPSAACGRDGSADVDGAEIGGFALMAQCRAVSALGFPALSVPVGHDRHGLPVSVQVVTAPGHEDLALGVGELLERCFGGCRPPPWVSA
jgi:amidase